MQKLARETKQMNETKEEDEKKIENNKTLFMKIVLAMFTHTRPRDEQSLF